MVFQLILEHQMIETKDTKLGSQCGKVFLSV